MAKLVEELLSDCPHLRILATSRERLGVYGESVVPLAPLACPDADKAPASFPMGVRAPATTTAPGI